MFVSTASLAGYCCQQQAFPSWRSFLAAWVCCGPRNSAPPLTACLPLVRVDGEWGCFESLGAAGCPQTDQPNVWQKLERELPRMRKLHHVSQTCESAQHDYDDTHAEAYEDYTRDDYTDDEWGSNWC